MTAQTAVDASTQTGTTPSDPAAGVRRRRIDASYVVWTAVLLLIAFLVLNPLGWLFTFSLRHDNSTRFTLGNYANVFTDGDLLRPTVNSFRLSASVALLSLIISAPAAWGVTRTNMPLRGTVRILILATFATPGYLGALAWVLMASPRAGMINEAYQGMTGSTGHLLNIYSWTGLILVTTLYTYPIVFLLLCVALNAIPSDLEEAANILGAGAVRTGLTVTFPLLVPAIFGGLTLAFLDAISDFGIPFVLGTPVSIQVISTKIWKLFQYPFDYGAGAALALVLLFVTAAILLLQKLVMGRRGYATLTGKATGQRRIKLGAWRYLLCGYCVLLVAASLLLPYAVLIHAAFAKSWLAGWTTSNLTLDNFQFVLFDFEVTRRSLINSLEISAIAATLAAVIGAASAYVSARKLVKGHQFIAFLVLAPFVLPSVVLAVGVFFAYSRPPFMLYGTLLVLVLAYLTKSLPIAFVQSRAAIVNVHPELEEAASVLGAGQLRVFRDVTFPLLRPGLIGAWVVVFVLSLRELSSAVFLYTADTQVIGVSILNFTAQGNIEQAAVMGVVLLFVTLLVLVVTFRLLGRNVLEMRSRS